MTTGMPELGSKISLISKADIRYEGRLYTVDPQECTIALSSVRSFGTEDRDTQYQIAPQSQIYDYILFRGSDIKDIRVVNSLPHPNDPAIMQVQLPNGQHLMPHFPMSNMNPSHSSGVGAPGFANPFAPMGSLSNIGNGAASSAGATASLGPGAGTAGSSGPFMMNSNQQQSQQQILHQKPQPVQQQKQPNMLVGASRSTTPISLTSRKSPSAEIGLQQMQQQQQQHLNQNQSSAVQVGNVRDAGHKRQNNQQRGNRNNDFYHYQQQHHSGRGGENRMDGYNQYQDGRHNYNQRNHPNQNRNWNLHRGTNNNNINPNMRNRMSNGRGRITNQGYRQGGLSGNQNKPRTKTTIKFEQDFDFEQANNKFEELRSQISKLKVIDDSKAEQLNSETDKKDDSGNETGAGDHEHEEEEITVGYDKTKSFFDNISCEAAQDRSKTKKNDWRQERKLNSETFGVSSTRRGSYRGRPSYYNNRNVNNYMGGVYNRGYRSNFRNRSSNRATNGINNRDGIQTTNGSNGLTSSTNTNSKNVLQTSANNANTVTTPVTAPKSTLLQENVPPHIAAIGSGQ